MTAGYDSARDSDGANLVIRPATRDDIGAIVGLLADDPLGSTRETTDDLAPYEAAYARVAADPGLTARATEGRSR